MWNKKRKKINFSGSAALISFSPVDHKSTKCNAKLVECTHTHSVPGNTTGLSALAQNIFARQLLVIIHYIAMEISTCASKAHML